MIVHLFKFASVAAVALLDVAFNAAPAAAGGCGYSGCETAAPAPVVVYQSGCGCGGGSYYYSYAPASTYPSSAYYGYAAYGDAGYGYPGYGYGYAYARARSCAGVSPYRCVHRFYQPRSVGARAR